MTLSSLHPLQAENQATVLQLAFQDLERSRGLSPSHFARAFRGSTGMPPHRWLLNRRIEKAKDALHNTQASLAAVATACGFADQSHFTRVFTRFVGISPGAWRRALRA